MKLTNLEFLALDTETASRVASETDDKKSIDELIEIGMVAANTGDSFQTVAARSDLDLNNGPRPGFQIVANDKVFWAMCKSVFPITPECSAIHDIRNEDIAGMAGSEVIMKSFADRIRGKVLVIHNAGFDWRVLIEAAAKAGVKLEPLVILDTWPVFVRIFKERRQHKLSVLKHALNIPNLKAHRAVQDSGVLAMVFNATVQRWLREGGVDDLNAFLDMVLAENEKKAEPFDVIPFGKHRDKKLADVPMDYLTWWLGKTPDPDKEPFYKADYSFAMEFLRRGGKGYGVTQEKIDALRVKCSEPIPWPHRLPPGA